jgi:hypothetical protein
LIGTFVLTLTAVPLYLWHFGVDWFQLVLFTLLFVATGFSITLGYHRLFSHITCRPLVSLIVPLICLFDLRQHSEFATRIGFAARLLPPASRFPP